MMFGRRAQRLALMGATRVFTGECKIDLQIFLRQGGLLLFHFVPSLVIFLNLLNSMYGLLLLHVLKLERMVVLVEPQYFFYEQTLA